jgi:2-dehydropantoate 2-reductase
MTEPGLVVNTSAGNSLFLGMTDDRSDARLAELQSALTESGVDSPVVSSIRDRIWRKALLNMTSSVVCLITGCRLSEMARDDGLRTLVSNAYADAVALAGAHGVDTTGMSVQPFLDKAPPHLPSIRQDFDRARPVELDALVVAPQRFARQLGLSTPSLDAIAALAIHQVRQAGLY